MKIKITRNLLVILLLDTLFLCGSFYLAHQIRFDFAVPGWAMEKFWNLMGFVLAVKLICFYFFDLYKGMWRYTSINDLLNIIKASTI
ncbi:MAG: polysaccharide biosynthesis protein, partial [Desulfotignum sp.]|nr:polysaccharide biosynthesis protein [Desulfotignum sp.]